MPKQIKLSLHRYKHITNNNKKAYYKKKKQQKSNKNYPKWPYETVDITTST